MKQGFLLYSVKYWAQNKPFKVKNTVEKMKICMEKLCEKRNESHQM